MCEYPVYPVCVFVDGYLCQVELSDFTADVFRQAAGEGDHPSQLAGISSNQLQVRSEGPRETGQTKHRVYYHDSRSHSFTHAPHPLEPQHLIVNAAFLLHQFI